MGDGVSDEQLLGRIAERDADAFAELWLRLGGPVLAHTRRILEDASAAEDAAQEAFTTIWRAAGTFDPERGSALAWIFTIARNAARDIARRRRVQPIGEIPDVIDPGRSVEDRAALEFERFGVHRAIATLGPRGREVIELAYFAGLSQSEIAERLDTPLGTVKTRTRNALAALADQLARAEQAL